MEKAEADDGTDLLPEKEWDRKIYFPMLSEDKTAVVFDVNLVAPSDTAKAAGKDLGATIKSIKPNQWQKGTTNLELELAVKREAIKSVEVLNAAGQALDAKLGNSSSNGK